MSKIDDLVARGEVLAEAIAAYRAGAPIVGIADIARELRHVNEALDLALDATAQRLQVPQFFGGV